MITVQQKSRMQRFFFKVHKTIQKGQIDKITFKVASLSQLLSRWLNQPSDGQAIKGK